MRFFQKPIFIGFLPNLLPKDVMNSLSFCLPWNWFRLQSGPAISVVESTIQNIFGGNNAITFDSGRTSLYFALRALGIQKDDEVAVQAYTCLVVSNAITFTGAKPLYIDIDENYTMDADDLEQKITARTKVLIIQHTFGISANLEALLALAKKYNLKVIEDCAHTFGGMYKNKFLGTFGDIGMFSFGTEKPFSCGRGGVLITQNTELSEKIRKFQKELSHTPKKIILQQFLSNIIFYFSKPLYNFGIGKVILSCAKKLHCTSRIIESSEKRGEAVKHYPTQLPNAFAKILLSQLEEQKKINTHRQFLTQYYIDTIQNKNVTTSVSIKNIQAGEYLLRFPLSVKNPQKLLHTAKKNGMILGDWYNTVIAPADSILEKMGYQKGTCPRAEKMASQSVNLPTSIHISKKDARRIVNFINNYAD